MLDANTVADLTSLVQNSSQTIQINALKVACGISENAKGREQLQTIVPILDVLMKNIEATGAQTPVALQLKESLQGCKDIVTWKP